VWFTMPQLMRHMIVLLVALAFSMSSVGWSVAGVVAGGMLGKGHHAAVGIAGSAHVGLQGDATHDHGSSEQSAKCDSPGGEMCGSDSQKNGEASSCCAAACHTAMLTSQYLPIVHMISHDADHAPLLVGMKEAVGLRFERPPRTTDI